MGHRPMNRDDIAALAKGMVPFVREVVTEALDKRMGGNGSQSTVRDGRVMDLQSAFDAGFEAVKSYVDADLGDIKKDIDALKAIPRLEYLGVWNAQKVYAVGNFVTDGGSLWHCSSPNANARPAQSDCWQLACKRGSDGKDRR